MKYLIIIFIGLLFFQLLPLTQGSQASSDVAPELRPENASESGKETHQEQHNFNIKEFIEKTLEAHSQAETYYEWEASSYHPHQLFEFIEKLREDDRSIYLNQLCLELGHLNAEKKGLFYSELSHWIYENPEPCLELSLNDIDIFYHNQSLFLMKRHLLSQPTTQRQNQPVFLGPSRVVSVNTENGPIFNYGDRGFLQAKELALTFDDGPHPRLTIQLLDILAEENVQATFFTVGRNINSYGNITQAILDDNHTLGTHSHTHRNLPQLDYATATKDIESAFDAALNQVGLVAPFFRFPFGSKNAALTQFVRESQFASFFWDVDTLDWKKTNPSELLRYTLEQINKTNRGIVLFHDIQPQTIAIMPTLLLELKARGYKLAVYQPETEITRKSSSEPSTEF